MQRDAASFGQMHLQELKLSTWGAGQNTLLEHLGSFGAVVMGTSVAIATWNNRECEVENQLTLYKERCVINLQ